MAEVGAEGVGYSFFLFQLVFAGTALTIVSGAMSERTGFVKSSHRIINRPGSTRAF